MTRSRTKTSACSLYHYVVYVFWGCADQNAVLIYHFPVHIGPHEFTSVTFPVKVLKLLIHDLRSKSESVSFPSGEGFVDTDDEDEEWTEEEQQHQGFKEDEFAFLSEMLGPRGANFDNDDIFDESDDEDLKNDPISQIDMKVNVLLTRVDRDDADADALQEHIITFFKDCAARNVNNFAANVDQLSTEEILVVRRLVGQ